jgi:hypothetical protein
MSVTEDSDGAHRKECVSTNMEIGLDNDSVKNVSAASTWFEVDRDGTARGDDHGRARAR